jgi:hypothetical protein
MATASGIETTQAPALNATKISKWIYQNAKGAILKVCRPFHLENRAGIYEGQGAGYIMTLWISVEPGRKYI